MAEPAPDVSLRVGDTVVLTGDHASMDRAAELLRPGVREVPPARV
jgi:K+/H+ antiporter YhaU regulatory subunit KhtT